MSVSSKNENQPFNQSNIGIMLKNKYIVRILEEGPVSILN